MKIRQASLIPLHPIVWPHAPILHKASSPQRKPLQATLMYRLEQYLLYARSYWLPLNNGIRFLPHILTQQQTVFCRVH